MLTCRKQFQEAFSTKTSSLALSQPKSGVQTKRVIKFVEFRPALVKWQLEKVKNPH